MNDFFSTRKTFELISHKYLESTKLWDWTEWSDSSATFNEFCLRMFGYINYDDEKWERGQFTLQRVVLSVVNSRQILWRLCTWPVYFILIISSIEWKNNFNIFYSNSDSARFLFSFFFVLSTVCLFCWKYIFVFEKFMYLIFYFFRIKFVI